MQQCFVEYAKSARKCHRKLSMRRGNVSSLTLPGKATWRLMVIALAGTMLVCCGGPGESGPTITPGPTNTPQPTSTESAFKTSMPTMAIASPTPTATSSEKGDSPRFELQGVTESEMTVLLENFRDAINERDMDWLSRQIAYPITAEVNEKFLVIGSPNEFVRHYDQIINKTITEIVLGQEVSDLFVNSKGILIGGREYSMGAIWLAYRCTSSSCDADTMDCPLHIISINNVSLDGSSEPVYIPTPTPPAINPNPDLAGLWDVVKIHLPGSNLNDCGDIQKKTETIGAAQLSIHRDGTMEFLDATCEPVNLEYKIWDTDTYYRLLSGSAGTASPFWDGIRQPYVQVMYPHCEAWPSYALIYLNPTSIVFSWEKYHLVMSKGQNDLSVPIAPTAGPEAVLCDPGPFADCQRANLIGAHLSFADLREADLTTANLSGASLRGALLGYSQLTGANLAEADLRGAYLIEAFLNDANLGDANLSNANLSWANLYAAILHGANLCGANLERGILHYVDLSGANLGGAKLQGAKLREANLKWANLEGASLSGADLIAADLSGANLQGANLQEADLRGANLLGADLGEAQLRGAKYSATKTRWPYGFRPEATGAVLG